MYMLCTFIISIIQGVFLWLLLRKICTNKYVQNRATTSGIELQHF